MYKVKIFEVGTSDCGGDERLGDYLQAMMNKWFEGVGEISVIRTEQYVGWGQYGCTVIFTIIYT